MYHWSFPEAVPETKILNKVTYWRLNMKEGKGNNPQENMIVNSQKQNYPVVLKKTVWK